MSTFVVATETLRYVTTTKAWKIAILTFKLAFLSCSNLLLTLTDWANHPLNEVVEMVSKIKWKMNNLLCTRVFHQT